MQTTTPDITVNSTLTGRQVDMSLDENSTAHLMGLFIDLYSDQERAVIREYSTNAYDSHIEAGQSRPIEVTLPSQWEPQLRIRDFGIGLSEADIVEIYSKYGASTKRDTDDQVGMLGLGCKSALTYTNQFTLVGIKYGVKTTVSISREDNGGGSMVIVDTCETDEPTGVEVIVPVDGVNSFRDKANDFFRFWEQGTVLVNGEMPDHLDGVQVDEDLTIISGHQDFVVMGNVAYPADLSSGLRHGFSLVANVPIGSVNFTPSREALQYTNLTKESIATIREVFIDKVVATAQTQIADATTPGEALRTAMEWRARLDGRTHKITLTYKGSDIPEFITGKFVMATVDDYRKGGSTRVGQVATQYVTSALFVCDYDKSFVANHKKKLNKYQEENGLDFNTYILCDEKIDSEWMEGATWVDWATIRAIKLPQNRTYARGGLGKPTGSYKRAYVSGEYMSTLVAADIDTTKPVFYTTDDNLFYNVNEMIQAHKPGGYTLVYLTINRVAKFKRDFPTAREPWDFLGKVHRRLVKKVTREDVLRGKIAAAYESDVYEYLDADRVDDPALKEAITLVKSKESAIMDKVKTFHSMRYRLGTTDVTLPTVEWESPLTNYPLCPRNSWNCKQNIEDIYIYLNAAYAARKESK